MKRRRALKALGAGLRGKIFPETNWLELIGLANEALVTPTLFHALKTSGALQQVPVDAAAFMVETAARNDERNRRLRTTAADAIQALNREGLQPVLLKGAALWASQPAARPFPRIVSDIDLLVEPAAVEQAIAALRQAGFELRALYPDTISHVAAELGRPSDVGIIDLHRHVPGPPGPKMFYRGHAVSVVLNWEGSVIAPSAADQVFLICLHDMIHDGGFWRGGFDLRHLVDIIDLTAGFSEEDWRRLDELACTRLLKNAIQSEVLAAYTLLADGVPQHIRRMAPRFHYWRHMVQYAHPTLVKPLAALGLAAELPNVHQHRSFNRNAQRSTGEAAFEKAPLAWGLHPDRVRGILRPRVGKV